jgi:hypothetical protein
MHMRTVLSLALCIAFPAAAQDFLLPMSGAVFNSPDHSIRRILGFAGAAYLSDPVLDGLDAAFIAPDGARALAIRDGKLLLASGLRNQFASVVDTGASSICADLVAWSDDSSAAAVYCRSTSTIQLLTGLQSETQPDTRQLDTTFAAGRLNAIALAPKGSSVAAAFEPGGIWLLAPMEAPRLLADSASPTALAFTPAGDSVFAADRDACLVLQVTDVATMPGASIFASIPAPVCRPSGISFAANGSRLWVADSEARRMRAYDLRDRALSSEIPLDISPSTLQPLISGSLFLLKPSDSPGEPFYVFNAAQGSIYFVPAAGGAK